MVNYPISAIDLKGFWILSIFTIFHECLKKVPMLFPVPVPVISKYACMTFSLTDLTLRESIIFLMSHIKLFYRANPFRNYTSLKS